MMSQPTNNDRARWAGAALAAFADETCPRCPFNAHEQIGDLLADLLHLCDAYGIDPQITLSGARAVYDAEITEQPKANGERL